MRSEKRLKSISFCAVIVLFYSAYAMAGTWTTLDMPEGRGSTRIEGIDGSNLVGMYEDGSYSYHGVLYDGANWTTLDKPGASRTDISGIDGSNLVGMYQDVSGFHSFLYDRTTWTTLGFPGAD